MTAAIAGAWRSDDASPDLVVTVGATTETVSLVLVSGREYWLVGDARADSTAGDGDLLEILATAIETHSSITTCTVSLVDGRVRIVTDVAAVLEWSAVATTLDPTIIGFTDSDTTSGTTTDAPNACPFIWIPGAGISFDSRERQDLVRGRAQSLSGLVYTCDFGDSAKTREFTFELLKQDRMLEEYAGSDFTAWETIQRESISKGRRLRVYDDETTIGAGTGFATYHATFAEGLRNEQWTYRWDVDLRLRARGLSVA